MTKNDQIELGKTLWNIANELRGAMDADDFRDYMLSFLFLRYLSNNYEASAKKELGKDFPVIDKEDKTDNSSALKQWYNENSNDTVEFEKQMRRKVHYVIEPDYLWDNITQLANQQSIDLLNTLEKSFKYIENESFESTFGGLFSEINLNSEKLGGNYTLRNEKLCKIISKIARGITEYTKHSDAANERDVLGDAYEYLIGQFAADSGKKAGEFYTPQQISNILSDIVSLDSQNPSSGYKEKLDRVLDFACGSGSLLLNVRKRIGTNGINKIYGQESNITTYNLARMNMLLHGVKDSEFTIHHGDSLANDWDILNEMNPSKKLEFDAIVANPPFSYRWEPAEEMGNNFRFKDYGLAPKSAADYAFLLHGFQFLAKDGTMAIILPHGALFRGGAEKRIREKLLKDGNIDTVIGLPSKLFFSTGIPVCILVLKKCKKNEDVLFINASEHFGKNKNQNTLSQKHIDKIIDTYKKRDEVPRYSRCVPMDEIMNNDYNLNIRRYADTSPPSETFDVKAILHGGVPIEEVQQDYIQETLDGINVDCIFDRRNHQYYDFKPEIQSKEQIRDFLKDVDQTVTAQFERWWDKYRVSLHEIDTQVKESEEVMWSYLKELGYD